MNNKISTNTLEPSDMHVNQHISERIMLSDLKTNPFPYFYTDHVFPDEYFMLIRKCWPDTNDFATISDTKRVKSKNRYKSRVVINIEENAFARLSPEKRVFWTAFGSLLRSESFNAALLEKFRPYVKDALNKAPDDHIIVADGMITRDKTEYTIGPHTDLKTKMITVLFYCPDDESLEQYGTSIYVPKNTGFVSDGETHYNFEKFRRHATMRFVPNSMFAFFRTDSSFHGVERVDKEDVRRDLVVYNMHLLPKDVVSTTG